MSIQERSGIAVGMRPIRFAPLVAVVIAALTAGVSPGQVELYAKKDSLQETMLATRARLAAWRAAQADARKAVKIGPWYTIARVAGKKFDAAAVTRQGIGLGACGPRGKVAWSKCPADGAGKPALGGTKADYLFTTITAERPVALSIELSRHEPFGGFAYRPPPSGAGVGPSDALVWLNGEQVRLDNRLAGYRRVPVAKRRGWHDAVLVDLPLKPGENRLLVSLCKGSKAGWFNSVRVASQPVPALWAMIEKDFPRSTHRLLEAVDAEWFDPASGWFAEGQEPVLERQMLKRLVKDLGADGTAVRRRMEQMNRVARAWEKRQETVGNALRGVPGAGVAVPMAIHGTPRRAFPTVARPKSVQGSLVAACPTSDRWLNLCVTAAELRAALRDANTLRSAIEELHRAYPGRYPAQRLLTRVADLRRRFVEKASDRVDPADEQTGRMLRELADLKREALVGANPLLAGKKLLVLKRYTYDSNHYYDEHNGGVSRFGGGLFVVSLDGKQARPIVPQLGDGVFGRYDLSCDARRIVFDYRPPKPQGFRIYEIGVDGTGLRQITFPPADEARRIAAYSEFSREALCRDPRRYGHWTDDMHPCYLPDGRIVFTSTRTERGVLCGGHSLTVTNLHRVNADGTGLVWLSGGALSEFCPTVMNDGRILYNRWEYVDKGAGAVQWLWAMCPDGSQSEEIGGSSTSVPPVLNQARQVPGRNNLIVCLGAGHCPGNMGAILLLDLHKKKRSAEALTALTPECLPQGNWGLRQMRNGRWVRDVYGPWYSDPYPLSDPQNSAAAGKFFLVSCNPEGMWNDPAGYGVYLLDVFGNRVPVYRDPAISCWQARPLEPRTAPLAVAGGSRPEESPGAKEATVVVSDVYQGLDGVAPGAVKYLRIMEQVPRPWSVYFGYQPRDSSPGEMVAVSLYTHLSVKVLHGVVPVRSDGSAYFTVPAGRDIFFQALDKDFMEIQRMRSFVNFEPGERRSCIGCHEPRNRVPPNRRPLALDYPPAKPQAQPGETAPRPLYYPTDVQPIFDRYCVSCHNQARPDSKVDLSGEMTTLFCRSYEEIIHKDLVSYIQEFIGPKPEGAEGMGYAAAVPPYTYGSHKSRLIAVIRAGHYGVKLPREDFIKLVTWIDANAPYYGSYFGHRNLAFRNRPDFRPVPTLQSALGIRPARSP